MARNPWPSRRRSKKPEASPAASGARVATGLDSDGQDARDPFAGGLTDEPDGPGTSGLGDFEPGTSGLGTSELGTSERGTPGADDAPDRPAIRRIALEILARREHSVAELRTKLEARDYPGEEIDAAIDELIVDGLLSEARFLESFLTSYARRGQGPVWIRAQLERRGLGSSEIAEALAATDIDWFENAREVRRKRFGAAAPADFRERARQSRFLQYRGFTADHIRSAVGAPGADEESA